MNTPIDPGTVPALIAGADKKLTALLAELADLGARRETAWADRDRAERDLDTAPRADTAALAGALRAGHADPGPRSPPGRRKAGRRQHSACSTRSKSPPARSAATSPPAPPPRCPPSPPASPPPGPRQTRPSTRPSTR